MHAEQKRSTWRKHVERNRLMADPFFKKPLLVSPYLVAGDLPSNAETAAWALWERMIQLRGARIPTLLIWICKHRRRCWSQFPGFCNPWIIGELPRVCCTVCNLSCSQIWFIRIPTNHGCFWHFSFQHIFQAASNNLTKAQIDLGPIWTDWIRTAGQLIFVHGLCLSHSHSLRAASGDLP